jgi:multidrug efflux pump subunit AcrA (membrane-fusion protein)
LEGGIVREILVTEGAKVKKGSPLLVLEDITQRTNREVAFVRYTQLRLAEARLEAEFALRLSFQTPAEAHQMRDDPRIASVYQEQMRTLRERHALLQQQLAGNEAMRRANRAQYAMILREAEASRSLLSQGFTTITQAQTLEREVVRLQGEYESLTADAARVRATYQRQASEELATTKGSLREIREQMKHTDDALTRTVIRAPEDGQVIGLTANTVGGVVGGGAVMMYVVPDNERLLLEGQVKPLDASYVHKGMKAEVRISGLPKRTAPMMHGEVVTVSSDTLIDEVTKMPYFLARVEVGSEEMRKLGEVALTPGMPVELLLKASESTVLEYLIAPWSVLFRKAMREY